VLARPLAGRRSAGTKVTSSARSSGMTTTETGNVTGTKDKDYNLLWFTEN
jgi:hypothetical protein